MLGEVTVDGGLFGSFTVTQRRHVLYGGKALPFWHLVPIHWQTPVNFLPVFSEAY